jgi:tetratricopeptide (TPR) repeat protein
MVKNKRIWITVVTLMVLILVAACGPDTIWLRPGLDTPGQHVQNGHQLLKRGKLDDACREFERARELDPNFTQAYVGLGLALGYKGEFQKGMDVMDQAKATADSHDEHLAVQNGYDQLKKMKQGHQ